MSLNQQLDSFRERFMARTDAGIVGAMPRSEAELQASGIAHRALRAGDKAPDFTLPEVRGGSLSLSRLLSTGPVVLSFYRGLWCPYCRLELAALRVRLPEITALGARLAAISPQKISAAYPDIAPERVPFALLCDRGSKVAETYGLAAELPRSLRGIYARFGHALSQVNDGGGWMLPLPVTYVVDRDARIAMSFVDTDCRNRLEPDALIAALAGLAGRERA
jgi:peroxiredoxin